MVMLMTMMMAVMMVQVLRLRRPQADLLTKPRGKAKCGRYQRVIMTSRAPVDARRRAGSAIIPRDGCR